MIAKFIWFIVFLIAVLYVISPIDFIPDIIPLIGWVDDVFVGIFGLICLFKGIKK